MNIVFLLQDTGTVYGAERATLDLAAGLNAAGHRPRFLLMEETRLDLPRSDLQSALRDAGLEFASIRVNSRFSFGTVNDIHERLVAMKADVLHCVGYKADVHGGMATRWGREWPFVSTVHGWLFRQDPKERLYSWINVHALRRARRVIALSRFYEDMLLEKGIARECLARIPSGLDVGAFQPLPPPDGVFTVGLMGRLSEEKNHSMFLRAARAVLDSGIEARFLIAGDGPEVSNLESQISNLHLDSAVSLSGFLSRDAFFRRVHVVTLCSRIENLPYTVIEAMAYARPVVATNVGGLPDLVDDAVSGFLVPADDAAELAGRLIRLAGDPALRSRMGGMGRYKVESEFDRDQMIARHIELYSAARAA
jgi:glycosyltransferase involved in cell wall biosynthesis